MHEKRPKIISTMCMTCRKILINSICRKITLREEFLYEYLLDDKSELRYIVSYVYWGSYEGGRSMIALPQSCFPPKNFHNQNEISQVVHVHNISAFPEWLEVPPECLRINLRASIFPKFPWGGGADPLVGTCWRTPPVSMPTFAVYPSYNLKILYNPWFINAICEIVWNLLFL